MDNKIIVPFKIKPTDVHDRLNHVMKESKSISECCQDLIDQAPFGNRPFYIFAHARTEPDGSTKRVIWQPRLSKPKAQTNSMLFKGHPGTDVIRVIWIIPPVELWGQYRRGNMTQNETIFNSITDFLHNRKKLEMDEDEDPTEEEAKAIYHGIMQEANNKKLMDKLYGKRE